MTESPHPVLLACQQLGDTVICQRCGATGLTYGFGTCKAALDERCEGFDTVERAAHGTIRTGEPTQ